jgi:hypothetical protein
LIVGFKITEVAVAVSTDQTLGMIRSRKPPQFKNRKKDSPSDSAYEELLVSHRIVKCAATDGKHPSRYDAPYAEFFHPAL